MLYFEIVLLSLISRYNANNILDVFYTTDKRIVGSLLHYKNYTLITDSVKIKNKLKKYIKSLNKGHEYKFIKSLSKVNDLYDIIFIDTESPKYNKPELEKYLDYSTKKTGVIIYSYYKKITDKIHKNYKYEIITFNNQKLLIYFNKIETKNNYIVMTPFIENPQIYFDNTWEPMNKLTDYVDLIFIEIQYQKYKKIYDIKSKYKSLININLKFNFVNKLDLYNYVKKDNKIIYKKYFMENYEIKNNKNCLKQIKKIFEKSNYWIVKPIPGYAGFGIKLFNNYKKCSDYIKNFNKKITYKSKDTKWVIQKYIDNPLIIKKYNKKFHLRVHILITVVDNKINLYLFKHHGFVLADKKFTLDNLSAKIHDTHFKSTKKEEGGIYPKYFDKMYGKEERLKVDKQILELFKYIKKQLVLECYTESKNCFKYYGADIIITNNYKVKLLEINGSTGGNIFKIYPKYKNHFYKGMFDIVTKNVVSKHYTKC